MEILHNGLADKNNREPHYGNTHSTCATPCQKQRQQYPRYSYLLLKYSPMGGGKILYYNVLWYSYEIVSICKYTLFLKLYVFLQQKRIKKECFLNIGGRIAGIKLTSSTLLHFGSARTSSAFLSASVATAIRSGWIPDPTKPIPSNQHHG